MTYIKVVDAGVVNFFKFMKEIQQDPNVRSIVYPGIKATLNELASKLNALIKANSVKGQPESQVLKELKAVKENIRLYIEVREQSPQKQHYEEVLQNDLAASAASMSVVGGCICRDLCAAVHGVAMCSLFCGGCVWW